MARISNEEIARRAKFREAAETAKAMLSQLRKEAAEIADKMARCEEAIRANELLSGDRKSKQIEKPSTLFPQTQGQKKRAKKGQVVKHIDAVLADGAAMDEPEIRKKIKEVFGDQYGRATVYGALNRGKEEHRYMKDGTKWKLSGLVTLKTA